MPADVTCSLDGCARPKTPGGRTWCKMHYRRFQRYGDALAEPKKNYSRDPFPERFWNKVDKTGDCWIWKGKPGPGGYARCVNATGLYEFAHRIAYQIVIGQIPEGLQLDHLCRVRLCVRPEHLEPVTGRENTLRGTSPSAYNAVKTHCSNGHLLAGPNLYIDTRKRRVCRACQMQWQRDYRARK